MWTLFGAPFALVVVFLITGWIWPVWIMAVGVWCAFAVLLAGTGITKLVNEPLSSVTIVISKTRSVLTKEQLLCSIALMLLVMYTFVHAQFYLTLLMHLVLCIVNMVTRAIAWYSRQND